MMMKRLFTKPVLTTPVALLVAGLAIGGLIAWPGAAVLAQDAPARPSAPRQPSQNPPDAAAAPETNAAPARRPAATLDMLFDRLAAAKTPEDARAVANLIQRRWARSGSDTADLLMTRAQTALKGRQVEIAIELLDRTIALSPDWAEAWNQRANALFMAGDSIRAMIDIAEALKREPRHYGAMIGLATILRQQGDDKRAMVAYRRVLAIYPQLDGVKSAVESLSAEVDGRDA